MSNPKISTDDNRPSNLQKDPDDWTTGDERMTDAQASYLKTLCEEAGEDFKGGLTKAEASKRIDELQKKTGRGDNASTNIKEVPPEDQNGRVDKRNRQDDYGQ
jgi:hypothetical protein